MNRAAASEPAPAPVQSRARGPLARLAGRWRVQPPPATGRSREQIEQDLLGRLVHAVPGSNRAAWVATLLVTALAAVLRLVHLDRPGRLVFDETYYVKQAYSLLTLGYEGQWNEEPDENFAAGDFSDLNPQADYVVHPPVGKWMIVIGIRLVGADSAVGWRISAAVIGALSVLLLVRIARRLFASTVLGVTAGLLLAIDGVHLVMSRISILDIFLQFWVLAGFAALLADRESYRRRLARAAAGELAEHGSYTSSWGPGTGVRWWLLAAGVLLGLASGVKWSGIYAVAIFGLFAVGWNLSARRAIGVQRWWGSGILRDGVPAFFTLVPTAAATYVLSWLHWFTNPNAYHRQWASQVNAVAPNPERPWLPDTVNSWWEYHLQMWGFHTGLDAEHTYQAHPVGWLIQWRPTSFAWRTVETEDGAIDICGAERCAGAISSVGNPVIWWGAALALILVIWAAVRRGDWRAWAILAGYLAGYAPWFIHTDRTVFTFYTVVFVPFVVLALTYALGELVGGDDLPLRYRRPGVWTAVGIVVLALVVSAWFWPIWTNQWVPYDFWHLHMWLPSWV